MAGIEFPKDQFPHGMCPLLSRMEYLEGGSIVLPVTALAGNAAIAGQSRGQVLPIMVPCVGDGCQLWDLDDCCCRLIPYKEIYTKTTEIGLDVQSPLAQSTAASVADSLSKIVNLLRLLIKTGKA